MPGGCPERIYHMKELELYVHIPFCIRKCTYCDFLSGPASVQEQLKYTNALIKEIKGYKEAFRNYIVTSIFIGGGTPSVIPAEQMQMIISEIRDVFCVDTGAEVTMEMNPGTVSEEKFHIWKKAGINRLSIGLQSADNTELKILGRIHTYEEFLDCFAMARAAGFDNVNVDLISAVPGQTKESFEQTLRKIVELDPEHISAYSLIIEEGTPFYELYGEKGAGADCGISLPDEEEDRRIYEMTGKILEQHGYQRYEISNYAKPGYECRHNLGYWERKDYLGIGTGAASLVNNVRFSHIENREDYVKILAEQSNPEYAVEKIKVNQEVLDQRGQMEEFMFLGLRKMGGISKEKFCREFGMEFDQVYGAVSQELVKAGLLCIQGDKVFLSKRGIDLSNQVFVEFIEPAVG